MSAVDNAIFGAEAVRANMLPAPSEIDDDITWNDGRFLGRLGASFGRVCIQR